MEGINYVTNGKGQKTAVQIDLTLYADVWDEFFKGWFLVKWWDKLDKHWRAALREVLKTEENPDKNQLQQLSQLTYFICRNENISTISPVEALNQLETLVMADTKISDLAEVASLKNLSHIDFINTNVSSLEPLQDLRNLHEIYFQNTKVNNLVQT